MEYKNKPLPSFLLSFPRLPPLPSRLSSRRCCKIVARHCRPSSLPRHLQGFDGPAAAVRAVSDFTNMSLNKVRSDVRGAKKKHLLNYQMRCKLRGDAKHNGCNCNGFYQQVITARSNTSCVCSPHQSTEKTFIVTLCSTETFNIQLCYFFPNVCRVNTQQGHQRSATLNHSQQRVGWTLQTGGTERFFFLLLHGLERRWRGRTKNQEGEGLVPNKKPRTLFLQFVAATHE